MSNEEIAVQIQAGKIELMGELWAGVENLVRWKANRVNNAIGHSAGVDFDDLCQSGYLALVAAVETYRPENGSFSSWLMLHLKTAFAEATGYRTVKGRLDPLNNALSLDRPLDNDTDGASFGELVPDPKAAATMDAVEEALWRRQLHDALESVLAELPEEQSTVLKKRYYDQQTLVGAAQQIGTTAEDVRKLEGQGLKALRHHRLSKKIRPFYDFDYYSGTGLGTFKNFGMSVQERYLICVEREESKQQHSPRE